MPHAALVERDTGQHRADEGLDARVFDLASRSSAPRRTSSYWNVIVPVIDDAAVERAFGRQVRDQIVGDAVRDLVRLGPWV